MKRRVISLLLACTMVMQVVGCASDKEIDVKTDVTEETEEVVSTEKPLYVICNFDVEDKRGNEPNLIEGDLSRFGIAENCGVDYIMDTFETYGGKATFFVNVYEYPCYDEDGEYMSSLLKRMSDRGFEVGLHTHSNSELGDGFYSKDLTNYSKEEQEKILKFGVDFIENATGIQPISHRGGAYEVNSDTLAALEKLGMRIDSSLYKERVGNELAGLYEQEKYSNQAFKISEQLMEIPIVNVFNGKKWLKLDFKEMSYEELIDAVNAVQKSGDFNCVQIMAHSFTFIRQEGNEGEEPLLTEGNRLIYGEDTKEKHKLESFLKYVSETNNMELVSFEEYLNMDLEIPELKENGSYIYLKNEPLAFRNSMIEIKRDASVVTMYNSFESSERIQYAWYVTDEGGEVVYATDYQENADAEFDFIGKSGVFTLKAYVKDEADNKVSSNFATVKVDNGEILSIERK